MAFIDTDMYIHTVCALKHFILIADVMKNVKLLRYRVSPTCHHLSHLHNCVVLPLVCIH